MVWPKFLRSMTPIPIPPPSDPDGEARVARVPPGEGSWERRLRRVLERHGDGFAIVDDQERITYANPAAEACFGVPPGTLGGRPLHDFLDPEALALVKGKTALRKAGMDDGYELRIRRPDGEARLLRVTVSPELDDAGRLLGSVGVFRDITEERRREDRTKASEARFRMVVDNAPMAIALTRNLRFLQVNPRFLEVFGLGSADSWTGRDATEFVHPEDRAAVRAEVDLARLGEGTIEDLFFRVVLPDGTVRQVHGRLRPILLEDGPAGLVFLEDITDRRRIEEDRERLIADLTRALGEVRQLSGLLPICSHCKKIRDDGGYWNQIESYLASRTRAQFTHGLCPDCMRLHFPEVVEGSGPPSAEGQD
jgi:PAS domain S-box-containing protein